MTLAKFSESPVSTMTSRVTAPATIRGTRVNSTSPKCRKVIHSMTAIGRDLAPLVIEGGGEMHLLGGAIEPDHLAQAITEPVPMRLGEVVQLVFAGVHAARRCFVQQRLPQMCPGNFHQRHARPPAAA